MELNNIDSQLQRYKIIKKIGKGAFGIVYKVKRREDGNVFALKTLDLSKMDKKGIESILNEIRILCSVDHEFICGYEEALTLSDGKVMCIVMEYLGGGDLESKVGLCKRKGMEIDELNIWRYIC